MMFTSAVYFMGRYRPAYWQAPTLAAAIDAARVATRDMPEPEGSKLRRWIGEAETDMSRPSPRYASWTSEHGRLGFHVNRRSHDPFLDSVTADMPHAPGMDYSGCVNLSDAEIDAGIDAEAERSRA